MILHALFITDDLNNQTRKPCQKKRALKIRTKQKGVEYYTQTRRLILQ